MTGERLGAAAVAAIVTFGLSAEASRRGSSCSSTRRPSSSARPCGSCRRCRGSSGRAAAPGPRRVGGRRARDRSRPAGADHPRGSRTRVGRARGFHPDGARDTSASCRGAASAGPASFCRPPSRSSSGWPRLLAPRLREHDAGSAPLSRPLCALTAALLWAWAVASGGRPARRGLLRSSARPRRSRCPSSCSCRSRSRTSSVPSPRPARRHDGPRRGDVARRRGLARAVRPRGAARVDVAAAAPARVRPRPLRRARLDAARAVSTCHRSARLCRTLRGASGSFFLPAPLPRRPDGREGRRGAGALSSAARAGGERRVALLAPASRMLVRAPRRWIERSALGVLRGSDVPGLYGVASSRAGALGPSPGDEALQLPASSIRACARSRPRAAGTRAPREARRTVAASRRRLPLHARPRLFRTGDPLAEFLFDKRAG